MANLIDCPACQRPVSSAAVSCPACGHPIAAEAAAAVAVAKRNPTWKALILAGSVGLVGAAFHHLWQLSGNTLPPPQVPIDWVIVGWGVAFAPSTLLLIAVCVASLGAGAILRAVALRRGAGSGPTLPEH